MKLAIMQPYFFPYIGYYQLINCVDEFVIYDNIEFTKKGWINRNRILVNGKDEYITIPLKKGSDFLNIRERYLADVWPVERTKMINRIFTSYKKAPFFDSTFPIVEQIIRCESTNLFEYIMYSIKSVMKYLEIKTPLTISSTLDINHNLKAEAKVLEICSNRKSEIYINPYGGLELYKKDTFLRNSVGLYFHKADDIKYKQFDGAFIPSLSIIDVMMFNPKEEVINHIKSSFKIL